MTIVVDEAMIRRIVAEEVQRGVQAALGARARDGGPRGDVGDDGLMTRKELAAMLGINPRDLRRLELQGEIPPGFRIGRRVRWRRRSIDAWLAKSEKRALDASRAGRLHVAGMNTAAHTGDPA